MYNNQEQPWVPVWHRLTLIYLWESSDVSSYTPKYRCLECGGGSLTMCLLSGPMVSSSSKRSCGSWTITTPIKFSANWSIERVSLLDIRVYLKNGRVETELYTKPTDKHQFLHMKSCHLSHCKTAIPFSQVLRLCRICSEQDNLVIRSRELKQYLIKQGYPEQLLDAEIHRAINGHRDKNNVFHWWWHITRAWTSWLAPPDATKLLCEARNVWTRFLIYHL